MISHTHALSYFGSYFPKYTGHLLHKAFWEEFFCVIRAFARGTSCERANYTLIVWEVILQLRTHPLHKRRISESFA